MWTHQINVMTQKDKKIELEASKVREKAEIAELNITRFQEDPSHMELEKCCGNCCWFYGEDIDGDGFCAKAIYTSCYDKCYAEEGGELCFVSRREMRHKMAVLLQVSRFYEQGAKKRYIVGKNDLLFAAKFAYEYMKIFSEL